MPEKKVAVAILNWNGENLLPRFLPSVIRNSPEAEIYVIDNDSTDDSLKLLRNDFPSVKIVVNEINFGYAGGYNAGMESIPEDLVVLLNSDVEVSKDWLQPLIRRMEEEPSLAAIQPKILDYHHRNTFEYAGAAGGYIDKWGYPFCRGRVFYELEEDKGQYDTYREVFWATGACLMVRNEVFKSSGGFNAGLFAHMEEIDLCWRLKNAEWTIACDPQSVVYHLGGGTLNKLSARKTYLNFRNNLIIIYLNTPAWEGFKIIIIRLLLDGAAAFKFLFDGQSRHFLAVLKAHFSFYRRWTGLYREKKSLKTTSVRELHGVYKKSLVWNFFVKKKRKYYQLITSEQTGSQKR